MTSTAPIGRIIYGSALYLDGTDDFASVPHASDLNAYPLSVTAWIKTTQSTGVAGIINKYLSSSGNGYQIFLDNGHARAWYFRDPVNYVWDGGNGLDGGAINDGQWHHLAFTIDSTGGMLYVDSGYVQNGIPGNVLLAFSVDGT